MEWFNKERYTAEVSVSEIIKSYDNKKLLLPLFQRDAVWSEGRICALWDSLLRGFPLPSFLLVDGDGNSRAFSEDKVRGKVVSGDTTTHYNVLDGQQRLWAIIAGTGKDPSIKLWVDLAPSDKNHPLRFSYWLHPCTRVFPFGFRMEAIGEHDFHPLHDKTFQEIWNCMQDKEEFAHKEFYEIPPSKTLPWVAGCPVPLADLLLIDISSEDINNHVEKLIHTQQNISKDLFGHQLLQPNPIVVQKVISGLKRISKTKLALQYIDLNNLEQDDGGGYALFERIGRGGIQISPRQLAVSKLMLELGKEGNDALASFQESESGCLIETEDVVHALARVALANDIAMQDKHDLSELSVERLQILKNIKGMWGNFTKQLSTYCERLSDNSKQTKLGFAFDRIFKLLEFHPNDNPYGFPLVQLAHFSRKREGIDPITLHPLLLWQLKHSEHQLSISKDSHRDEMLRWILFANGLTNSPHHSVLNREMFDQVNCSGYFSFTTILDKIFNNNKQDNLLQDLGFQRHEPTLRENDDVEDILSEYKTLPTPSEVATLTAKHLILRNSVYSGISDFILMWNQRKGLHEMYGKVEAKHIPALFGKGRPFESDHIAARSRFLYINVNDDTLWQGCRDFFKANHIESKHFVRDWCFRKNFPNITANYRYWPKRLNRADNNLSVAEKMSITSIRNSLQNHPLSFHFNQAGNDDIPWSWSAIPEKDWDDWKKLPPSNNIWTADLVKQFIQLLLQREYYLYRNAYTFLNINSADLSNNAPVYFDCFKII